MARRKLKRQDPLTNAMKRTRKLAKTYGKLPKGHALRTDVANRIKGLRQARSR